MTPPLPARSELLTQFRSLIRNCQKFPDYNIREYVKRRTVDAFRENPTLTDPAAIATAVADARSQLEVAKRQSIVYSLYAPKVKNIMELHKN